jgi:UDP-N-acetyl-D-glucosamine dehydrogenase
MKTELLKKIESGTAVVGIVGMGYVGLPLAVAFAQKGYRVIGVDVAPEKVTALNNGHSYVEDIRDETLAPLVQAGLIQASTSYDALVEADAISICVPTPLRKTKDPDISYIIAAADEIARVGATGKLIVLESTTYPGTTEEVIVPRLINNGNVIGQDVFVAFSPERIDPGRTDYTVWTTPKVIGGMTPDCLEIALSLYGKVVQQPVPVSSPAAAEMVKLLENTFRAVNIALVNEVALMCDRLGLDVWEVVEAAATKPYGFMKFTPGPGVGGHCIPLDPHYLSWKLKTLNYNARFIELASDINSHMPDYVVSKVADALNVEKKAINGSRILVLGVSYKPNVGDVRESPALDIIHLLQERGAEVRFHDPFVADLAHEGLECERIELTSESLRAADCVVVVTNHAAYDWQFVAENASLIVDTRNAMKGVAGNGRVKKL